MKVALISLYNYQSIGVRFLSSFLENNNHETYPIFLKQVFANVMREITEKEYELLINKLREINPDLIGISLMCSGHFNIVKNLIKRIGVLQKKVIIGGVHPTIMPEETIKEADFICLGEGEHTLLELMNSLRDHKDVKKIKGLWINENGNITRNEIRNLSNTFGQVFPFLPEKRTFYIDYDNFEDANSYSRYVEGYNTISSRGCPYRCTYCTNNVLHKIYENKGSWLRKREIDDVINELIIVKKNNPKLKYIKFYDDLFLADADWVKDFCKKYKEKINIPFYISGHFNFCNKEILNILNSAGCKIIRLGIQSGSKRIRKMIYKRDNYSNEDIIKVSNLLSKLNIITTYDLITDNPFETLEDKDETVNLLIKLKKPFRIYLYSLIYFPKTEITEMALKAGLIKKEDIENIKGRVLINWRTTNKDKGYNSFYNFLYSLTDTVLPRSFIKFIHHRKDFFAVHQNLMKPLKIFVLLSKLSMHSLKSLLKFNEFKRYIPYTFRIR